VVLGRANGFVCKWLSWEGGIVVSRGIKVEIVLGDLSSKVWPSVLWLLVVRVVVGVVAFASVAWWWIVFVVARVRITVDVVVGVMRGHPATVAIVALWAPTPFTIVVSLNGVWVLRGMMEPIGW